MDILNTPEKDPVRLDSKNVSSYKPNRNPRSLD
nr:MAG TPA: hypothetical protein [Caudoviricetes sp.]